jgi:hypothetical protein
VDVTNFIGLPQAHTQLYYMGPQKSIAFIKILKRFDIFLHVIAVISTAKIAPNKLTSETSLQR